MSGGLGQVFVYVKLAPTTYTKTGPAYATPFVPTLLKTASPERLLRPPLASSPASIFFSLYNAPSQEASGNSLYMWPRPPLASPHASLFFSLYTVPSQKASGKSHSEASPGHIYKNLPRLCYPLRTYPPFKASPTLLPSFKFLLPLHCPLSGGLHSPSPEALGTSLYMPTLLKTPSPERLLRPPP